MAAHWWHAYWAWAGSNIGAMPAQFVITAVATLLIGRPAARLWRRIAGEHPALAEARAARRITADLYERHTGQRHELAPDKESGER